MSKKRGPDGIPMDVPSTAYIPDPETTVNQTGKNRPGAPSININLGEDPTVGVFNKGTPGSRDSLFLDEPPTTPPAKATPQIPSAPAARSQEVPAASSAEPKTVIAGGRRRENEAGGDKVLSGNTATESLDPMADPLAGWLVVIGGPGQGNFLKIGYGMNSIGRSQDERIALNFGDAQISRNGHCLVTYDPRGKQFYLQPGGSGTNLTYLNDFNSPVLAPTVLAPFSHIILGDTILRFVPFCDAKFTWESISES